VDVGVVLPGGGARGACEAGALSVLLPALEARGERVSIVCGTSVGSINAAFLAGAAAQPAAAQAEALLAHWRELRKHHVIAGVIGPRTALSLLRLAGELLEVPGLRAASLLDPSPLARNLDRWLD
jgi:NTE family protein